MFSVVTDSQFELPQIFISQIDRGSIALSLRWVSAKRGVGIGASAGKKDRSRRSIFFILKNAVLGLGLRLVSSLTIILSLKQHSLKKEIDPDPAPGPTPRFTHTPKLMVAIILIQKVILKKKKL